MTNESEIKLTMINDFLLKSIPKVGVRQMDGLCVLVLPSLTADNRLVEIFMEKTVSPNFWLVHDAGKAANELILQGADISRSMDGRFHRLARRFGVAWERQMFKHQCQLKDIPPAALAIASCVAVATAEIVDFRAVEAKARRQQRATLEGY